MKEPLIVEAFSVLREEAVDMLLATKPSASEDRERAYLYIRALDRFKQSFEDAIATGEAEVKLKDSFTDKIRNIG